MRENARVELNSVPFTVSFHIRYGFLSTGWLYYLITPIYVIESYIVSCVISYPRAILIVSYTVIVLLSAFHG